MFEETFKAEYMAAATVGARSDGQVILTFGSVTTVMPPVVARWLAQQLLRNADQIEADRSVQSVKADSVEKSK